MLPEPVWTVYKTTQIESGKFYFGVHKTRKPDDRYLGSGKHIKAAVKKHGRDAFHKEVLFVFDNPDDAYTKEAELADDAHVSRADTYNLMRGGTYSQSDKFGQPGEENSQHGTTWITDGKADLKHPSGSPLPKGWRAGRAPRPEFHSQSVWVNHPSGERRRVSEGEVAALESQGWRRGQRSKRGRLTWPQVREIRRLNSEGVPQTRLAEQFKVSQGNVSLIVRGETWVE